MFYYDEHDNVTADSYRTPRWVSTVFQQPSVPVMIVELYRGCQPMCWVGGSSVSIHSLA